MAFQKRTTEEEKKKARPDLLSNWRVAPAPLLAAPVSNYHAILSMGHLESGLNFPDQHLVITVLRSTITHFSCHSEACPHLRFCYDFCKCQSSSGPFNRPENSCTIGLPSLARLWVLEMREYLAMKREKRVTVASCTKAKSVPASDQIHIELEAHLGSCGIQTRARSIHG